MSQKEAITNISLEASGDLSANQFRFVKVNSSGQTEQATAAADAIVGVQQDKPKVQGEASGVLINGVSIMIAGGTVAAGAVVTTDAQGRAVAAATGNTGKGICLKGGAVGEQISVLITNVPITP